MSWIFGLGMSMSLFFGLGVSMSWYMHSHKKRNDSLETRTERDIFSL